MAMPAAVFLRPGAAPLLQAPRLRSESAPSPPRTPANWASGVSNGRAGLQHRVQSGPGQSMRQPLSILQVPAGDEYPGFRHESAAAGAAQGPFEGNVPPVGDSGGRLRRIPGPPSLRRRAGRRLSGPGRVQVRRRSQPDSEWSRSTHDNAGLATSWARRPYGPSRRRSRTDPLGPPAAAGLRLVTVAVAATVTPGAGGPRGCHCRRTELAHWYEPWPYRHFPQ